jgi:hypothetical protein
MKQVKTNYDEIKPTKCIFKVNHIFRISVLLLHVSALLLYHSFYHVFIDILITDVPIFIYPHYVYSISILALMT